MKAAPLAEDRAAARVLAVGVDELTLGRLKTAVRGTEFAVISVPREEVLGRAQATESPVILLVEWADDDSGEDARLCDALRRIAPAERLYVIALGGPADHEALLRATEGPANDALSRPFDSALLLVRLRHALRAMRSAAAAITPHAALDEALRHGNGEVCVRSGNTVARIHVQSGHIVWANISSVPASMEDVAAHGGVTLDPDLIAAVKQECRATSAHFMDVLVTWGIIEQDRAREAVRSFVTERVKLVLELPEANALFLPAARPKAHSERLRFRASEIPSLKLPSTFPAGTFSVEPTAPESRRPPALPLVALADIVEAAMRTEGAIGAAILERATGACLHHAGDDLDTEIAWSQLSALAALGPDADELLGSAGDRCFVTRPLRGTPSLMLFVALSSQVISLGLARAAIAAVASQRGSPARLDEGSDGAAG